jgi:CRISPR-associated protein Cas6
MIELHFPVLGSTLPTDHGYALYAALSRRLPVLHQPDFPVFIGPISGQYVGNGKLELIERRSRLRLRLPAERLPDVLRLAGNAVEVDGHQIRISVPQVYALVPAPDLIARLVTIKRSNRSDRRRRDYMEPSAFLDAVRRELAEAGIKGEPAIPLVLAGDRAGQPRRHVLRVKDRRIVGFSLQVTGLTADESVRLQERGLGGRKRMGCGFFGALRTR